MKKLIIAVLLVLSLAGCSHQPAPNNTKYIQENTLVECSKDTPIPAGLTGADAITALTEWQTIYNQCRATHHALIEAVRNDNSTKNN